MASTINASSTGSGGLISTGDASGQLALQANGVTQATVSSTGLAMATGQTINTNNTYGFKNRIINGNMVVNQYTPGSSVSSTAGTTVRPIDRFFVDNNGSGTVTCAQSTSVYPAGFTNSLSLTVTATDTAAAGDYLLLSQAIEGYNTADLNWGTANAATITVSFWVRSSITGTYGASIRGGTSFQSYPFTYTINAANTWEQKTATIAGPTTGTFASTTSQSFQVMFDLGSGSNFNGTANTWQSGSYWRTSACVSWIANSAATFYMTGLQIEVGSQATSFDFRSIGQELALCQRYYSTIGKDSTNSFILGGYGLAGAAAYATYTNPVTMRTNPTVTAVGTFYVANCGQPSVTGTAGATSIGFATLVTSTGGFVVASSTTYYFTVSAEL
jgi:hypothetical protein